MAPEVLSYFYTPFSTPLLICCVGNDGESSDRDCVEGRGFWSCFSASEWYKGDRKIMTEITMTGLSQLICLWRRVSCVQEVEDYEGLPVGKRPCTWARDTDWLPSGKWWKHSRRSVEVWQICKAQVTHQCVDKIRDHMTGRGNQVKMD